MNAMFLRNESIDVCPHCAGTPAVHTPKGARTQWTIRCMCGAMVVHARLDVAIANWNRRVPAMAPVEAELVAA